jgi:hypothetical protein
MKNIQNLKHNLSTCFVSLSFFFPQLHGDIEGGTGQPEVERRE